jgi:hypothetical protein
MLHSNEQLKDWISAEWVNDYFRFEDVAAEFKVSKVVRVGNSLEVSCQFIGDETQHGNTSADYVMLTYDPEFYSGCFPTVLQIVHLTIRYTWPSQEECDQLAESYDEENLELDINHVNWDDPRLTDEAVDALLGYADQSAIAATLLSLYDCDKGLPAFVPERLKPYFKKYIEDFKLDNN